MPDARVAVDNPSGDIALTTALSRVYIEGPHVDVVYINALADIYLVVTRMSLDTGGVVPTERYRIPAGTCHPLRVTKARILLAAMTGTTTAWVVAMADQPFPLDQPTNYGSCG